MIKKLKEFKHPQLNNNVQKYMEKIKDQMLTFDGKGVFDTLETKLKEKLPALTIAGLVAVLAGVAVLLIPSKNIIIRRR